MATFLFNIATSSSMNFKKGYYLNSDIKVLNPEQKIGCKDSKDMPHLYDKKNGILCSIIHRQNNNNNVEYLLLIYLMTLSVAQII
jgi:hypothetical protein